MLDLLFYFAKMVAVSQQNLGFVILYDSLDLWLQKVDIIVELLVMLTD